MEELQMEQTPATYERDLLRESVPAECSVEHTLPDYMPEIRKILRVDAREIPGGRYLDDAHAEFAGIVGYTVTYTDGEGRLSAVSLNGDYTVTAPMGGCRVAVAYMDAEVENTVCRLGGPRRLSLRSTLRCRPHLVAAVPLPHPEAEGCERLVRRLPARRTLFGESGEIAFSDGVGVPGCPPEGLHPISCDGSLMIEELRPAADAATLRGTVCIRILAVTEEGRPMSFTSRIPLESEIACEGLLSSDACLPAGQVTSVSVRATGDGEGGTRLEIDGTAECRLLAYRNEEATPTVGMYAPAYRTEVRSQPLSIERLLGTARGHYTASGSLAVASGEERASVVLDSAATATVRKITEEAGHPVVLGDVRVKLLLGGLPEGEETAIPCFSVEYTHPFRIEAPIEIPAASDVRYECRVVPLLSRGRIEEGGYAADTELALSLAAFDSKTCSAVDTLTPYPEERFPRREGEIVVVYPEEGETLWSVAERYHTTPAALARANRLPIEDNEGAAAPASLDGVAYLLVE